MFAVRGKAGSWTLSRSKSHRGEIIATIPYLKQGKSLAMDSSRVARTSSSTLSPHLSGYFNEYIVIEYIVIEYIVTNVSLAEKHPWCLELSTGTMSPLRLGSVRCSELSWIKSRAVCSKLSPVVYCEALRNGGELIDHTSIILGIHLF